MVTINEQHKRETKKFEEDLTAWQEVYLKFKHRLDELASYEKRVNELEIELEKQEKLIKANFEREKDKILALAGLFTLASLMLVGIIYSTKNIWLFFAAGLLIGVGATFLLRFWINIR